MRFNFSVIVVLLLCSLGVVVSGLDWATANTSVWLSSAAYCETNTYQSRTYIGYSKGFMARYVIEDKPNDVQGYIGYLPSQSTIYVVFRGSTSIKDWVHNIDVILTKYPLCSGCEVHKGWYKSQQAVSNFVANSVQALQQQFPTYHVVVTGHSLGAAMATLTAADLKQRGLNPVLFHFGSPRIGNTAFAEWFSSYIGDRNRVTHYKDMVPHLPMHERFKHISGEWYEDKDTSVRQCIGYEDPNCSYQWHITNIPDHMTYLTMPMGCDAASGKTKLATSEGNKM